MPDPAQPDSTRELIDRYRDLLSTRQERISSEAIFCGGKNHVEKALMALLESDRDAQQANSVIEMLAELASFVSAADYELFHKCRVRGEQDPDVGSFVKLVDTFNHEAIQKELDARKDSELVRYYALCRRVMHERAARRQQAESVLSLNAPSADA